MAMERLARPFRVTVPDDDEEESGTFEGLGAVFNDVHRTSSMRLMFSGADWKDRIMPGAFAGTLARHAKAGTMPSMLYMHERGNVVGAWRSMAESKSGLDARGVVSQNAKNATGAGIYELMKMGGINALSIGFDVLKETLDEKKKLRDINEVELNELSIVDVPGIPSARITDVKTGIARIEMLERVLRDAGLSRREAKALLADGFKALRDAEDEASSKPTDSSATLPREEQNGNDDTVSTFLDNLKQFAQSIKP